MVISKVISRFFHLISAAYLIGQSFNIFLGTPFPEQVLTPIMGALVIITGFANMIILIVLNKPDKVQHKWWKYMLFLKIGIVILSTPLSDWFYSLVSGKETVDTNAWKLSCMIVILTISVVSRYYREDVTKNFTKRTETNNEHNY